MNVNNFPLFEIEPDSTAIDDIQVDRIKVLVVDDQDFARKFLEKMLDAETSELKVIGTANNGQQALQKVEFLHPDVVLIDLEMPEMDGVSATKIITQRFPNCKVLVLSSHDSSSYLNNALQAGAKGYLLKNTPGEEIRNAISSVNKGYYQVGPGLLAKAFDNTIEVATTEAEAASLDTQDELKPSWSGSTQELLNTLPRVWSRGFIYLLIILMAIGLPWTILAKIDETGTARGKIEPKGKTLEIDAAVSGKVTEILAEEGEVVRAGQELLKIESEAVVSQLEQQRKKLIGQQNQLTQLESLRSKHLQTLNSQQQQNQAQTVEKQAQLEQAQQNVESSDDMYSSQKQEKQAQLEQAQKAIQTSQAAYDLAKIRVKSTAEKVPRYRQAFKDGAISQDRLLETVQQAEEAKKEVEKAKFELEESRSRLQELQSSYQTLIEEQTAENEQTKLRLSEQQGSYGSLLHSNDLALLQTEEKLQDTEAQIASLKGEVAQTKNQIKSLEFELTQYTIKAPVKGTIFEFPIQNAEATVESGETIAAIAQVENRLYPESDLVLRGRMPSSETASLKVGLPAKIKLDAYPFQDYGIVEGHVTWISPDSKVANNSPTPTPTPTPTPEQAGEFFELEISIDQIYLETKSEQIAITPGQTAVAEVVVRQRRLIDYFLEPFQKLKKGGLEL